MPFLRVLRDKRGYETTYLVHWFRDGHRQRSKILYVFRTPPVVRVGRDALDPAVVRELEAQHPDIEFDWRALFDNRQVVDQTPDPRRQQRPKKKPVAPATATAAPAAPSPPLRPVVPGAIEGETREEQLAFLAKWYPELRDRIPHRTQDPIRRDALLALVERLNAAAWETEEQIVAGLQSAAEALYRLSRIFSKRRHRPRRVRPSEPQTASQPQTTPEPQTTSEPPTTSDCSSRSIVRRA